MYLISGLIIAVITYASARITVRARKWTRKIRSRTKTENVDNKESYRGGFWDIIREGDYFPSLGRFQFMMWTIVISFAFLSIYLIRVNEGITTFDEGLLPTRLLELMGISVFVPVIGNVVSRYKHAKALLQEMPLKDNVPPFSTMLLEGNKPTLARYQMFLWTLIGVALYLLIFFSNVSQTLESGSLQNLTVPDIDSMLVVLMGLSQSGYLGSKLVARGQVAINKIEVTTIKNKEYVSIFGMNFGEKKGSVWCDNQPISEDDIRWDDTRIDILKSAQFSNRSTIKIRIHDGTEAQYEPSVT